MKLSNLKHSVTMNATAADGHKSCVIVHCNQMLQVGYGRQVQILFFWRTVLQGGKFRPLLISVVNRACPVADQFCRLSAAAPPSSV